LLTPRRQRSVGTPESIIAGVALPDPGNRFPAIALRDEKGQIVARPPGETLFGFFKTACPTSALAWPYLDRIVRLGQGGAFSVQAVSQDDPETTARFYAELGIAVPTVYDVEPWAASDALGLTNVPTFILVGEDGVVADTAVGFQRHKMEQYADLAAERAGRPAQALFGPGESVPAIKPG
jgi:hypothetical protein